MDIIPIAASLIASLSTGAGALPIILKRQFSEDALDTMLGFSAGIMLAAAAFGLLTPSIRIGGHLTAALGLMTGAIFLHIIDRFIPHFHPVAGLEGPKSRFSKHWLFIFAMTIHNFPEGLAVGVGFGTGDIAIGMSVAVAISMQNAPEGLAVAIPLLREKYNRIKAIGYATLTGLVEPIGAFLGLMFMSITDSILSLGLAFAAGSMLFVVMDEMVPESHKKGFGRKATFGLLIGFTVMILFNSLFH